MSPVIPNDAPPKTHHIFIQWKGTDVCLDFNCPECGHHGHFDGYYAYALGCKGCGAIYEMPQWVSLDRNDDFEGLVAWPGEDDEVTEVS